MSESTDDTAVNYAERSQANQAPPEKAPGSKKRRLNVTLAVLVFLDIVRALGVIFLLVVPFLFLMKRTGRREGPAMAH